MAARHTGSPGRAFLLISLVAVQLALGILTLRHGVALPLAVAHQAVAALLLAAMVWAAHGIGAPLRTRR